MTHRHPNPDPDDHPDQRDQRDGRADDLADTGRDRPAVDPLRPGRLACPCGATAGRDGLCRKCRARALYGRRSAGRRAHPDRPAARSTSGPPAAPTPSRPRSRRPGR